MKDGVRIVNCARGELVDLGGARGGDQVRQGGGREHRRVPGEPVTEHPLFAYENVVVTPHLGASTAEAQDRAGVITAEQVVAALRGELVSNAVNIPRVGSEDLAVLEPYMPLSEQLGALVMSLARATSVDRIEAAYHGHLAEFDTRLLTLAVLNGAFRDRVAENVNFVNAPAIAEERGIRVGELKESESRDYANLVSVTVVANGDRVEVAGTTIGPRHVPHLTSVYGQSFTIELAPYMAVFRYSDVPGMIGKVGTVLGEHGINIASTAVGREPRPGAGHSGRRQRAPRCHGRDRGLADPRRGDPRHPGARGLPGRPRGHAVAGGPDPGDRARPVLRVEDRRHPAGRGTRGHDWLGCGRDGGGRPDRGPRCRRA